jgi:hypothetical protein
VRVIVGTTRYWLPLVAGCVCLVVAAMVPPIIAFVLIVAAFGLLLDGSTAMFERAGRTGGLSDHKQ